MNIITKIKGLLLHYTWDLAYGKYDDSIIEKGLTKTDVNVVKNPYKTKWFADPFIYEDDERFLQLFVEEFDKKIKRGRIARIRIDKSTNAIVECKIILDLPTHLSFPAIYRVEDRVYVHPENSESGNSYMYEYDVNADCLVNPVLVVDKPLTDAVIRKAEEGYTMTATLVDNANGNVMSVFQSQSFLGPYKEKETLTMPNNSARMAGHYINTKNGIIRPAQNCNGDYGKAVWFYNDDVLVGQILPWGKYDGVHTFNNYGCGFVIDLKVYDFVHLYRLKNRIRKHR